MIVDVAGVGVGLGIGTGALLIVDGLRRRTTPPTVRTRRRASHVTGDWSRRAIHAAIGVIVVVAVTGWPIAALAAGVFGWYATELLGNRAGIEASIGRTEAIAGWIEMLRDTIGAAHGLESAITATTAAAPTPIRPEINALAFRLGHQRLDQALEALAVELDHPIGDLIVAALTAASQSSVRELAGLLSTLAASARDEATMQLRVDAARGRVQTAVRVVSITTLVTAIGLVVFNPAYVTVYATPVGQAVLAAVAACWGLALTWLTRMSRFTQPERFLTPTASTATPS
jgi:hypothetical protein